MKYQIVTLILLFSSFSIADKMQPTKGPKTDLDPTYTIVKKNADNNFKGTLIFDPKSCQFKILRDGVMISVVDNNFLIELPDQRTVVGVVEGVNEAKGKPACFHSLSEKPSTYKGEAWKVFANKTAMGGAQDGMTNCKNQNGGTVTDAINYLPEKEYKANCAKDSGNCRKTERTIRIKAGAGLLFYEAGQEKGSNVRRDSLKFDESYRDKCETGTPNKAPVKPTPATAGAKRTT